MYCDTSIIAEELERRFPASAGYGPSFPQPISEAGSRLMMTSFDALSNKGFATAVALLPEQVLANEKFAKDREFFSGRKFTAEAFKKGQPIALTQLRAQLSYINEQVQSHKGQKFLLGNSDAPSYADVAMWFPIAFTMMLHGRAKSGPVKEVISDVKTYPYALGWFKLVNDRFAEDKKKAGWKHPIAPKRVDAKEAAEFIKSAPKVAVTFDEQDPMVAIGWAKKGAKVNCTPTDSGKVPQEGTLVGLSTSSATLEVASSGVHVHFPRIDFIITPAGKGSRL